MKQTNLILQESKVIACGMNRTVAREFFIYHSKDLISRQVSTTITKSNAQIPQNFS